MTRRRITLTTDQPCHAPIGGRVEWVGGHAVIESVEDIPDPVVQKFVVTVTHPDECPTFNGADIRVGLERRWPGHTFDVEEVAE